MIQHEKGRPEKFQLAAIIHFNGTLETHSKSKIYTQKKPYQRTDECLIQYVNSQIMGYW